MATVIKGSMCRLSTEGSSGAGVFSTNGVITGFTLNYEAELHDRTVMLSSFRKRIPGLKNWSVTVDLLQNYADSAISEKLWMMVGSTCAFISLKPTSDTVKAANPSYRGAVCLESYTPLAGAVGELAVASITFQGNGELERSESA